MVITIKQILLIILILLIFWSASPHWINLYENGSFLDNPLPNQNNFLFNLSCINAVVSCSLLILSIIALGIVVVESDFLDKKITINFKFNKLLK